MFADKVLWFLLIIRSCISSTSQETRLITIRKTIHKNETLTYNITDMFPGLIEDPRLESMDSSNGTSQPMNNNDSNVMISEAIIRLFDVTFTDQSECSLYKGLNFESFVGICSDRKEVIIFVHHPLNKSISRFVIFVAPEGQTVLDLTAGSEDYYFLCKISESRYAVHVFERQANVTVSVNFSFEAYPDSQPSIEIDTLQDVKDKRVFVYSKVQPQDQVSTELLNTQFVTLIYQPYISNIELEGIYSSSNFDLNPFSRLEHQIVSIADDYADSRSYLSILPFEKEVWILNSVKIDEIQQYMVQQCTIIKKKVKRTYCKNVNSTCSIESSNCTEPLTIGETTCKFNFDVDFLQGKRREQVFSESRKVRGDQCNIGAANCSSLIVNCVSPIEAPQCLDLEVRDPVVECFREVIVGNMCYNLAVEDFDYKQFYIADVQSKDKVNTIFLLTNCHITQLSFETEKGISKDQASKSGYFKFSRHFKSASAMERSSDAEIFAFLRPYESNITYLSVYSEDTHTARIFQNQFFRCDYFVPLMDMTDLQRDHIVSITFNKLKGTSNFKVFSYQDQPVSIRLRQNQTFVNNSTKIEARLVAGCAYDRVIVYHFDITVLNSLSLARKPKEISGVQWYYSNKTNSSEWIAVGLPVEMMGLDANDPHFSLDKRAPGLEIESQTYETLNNSEIFSRGSARSKSLFGYNNTQRYIIKGTYTLFVYSNDSAGIMNCQFAEKTETSLRNESIQCDLVLKDIPLPNDYNSVITFHTIEDYQGYYQAIILVRTESNHYKAIVAPLQNGSEPINVVEVNIEPPYDAFEFMEATLLSYSHSSVILIITAAFRPPFSETIMNNKYMGALIPFTLEEARTIMLEEIQTMNYYDKVDKIIETGPATFAVIQKILENDLVVATVVSWVQVIVKRKAQLKLDVKVEEVFVLNDPNKSVIYVSSSVGFNKSQSEYRLITYDTQNGRVLFRSLRIEKIQQLDTNVRPIYEGVLPVPGLDTNGDSIKDLVDIDVIQGIFIMGLNRSETDTANITKQFIDIYVVDMRGNDDDPIGRLRLKMTVEVPPYNGPLLVLQYLDPVTLRIHALICFEQGNIHVVGELHGSKATLKILPSKLGNGITERNMRYSGSACNESDSLLVPLKIVAAEWDDVIVAHATSNPYDLENNETSILEIESHLINIASHRAGYDVIAPESFKGTFEVIPMIVPDKRVSSLILPQPFQFKAEDKIFVHDDAHLLIRGKNSVTIFKIDSGRPPILLFNKTYSQNVLTAYMTYDPKMNYKVRGSGPLEFVFVLLKGDYDKNDVDMNVYDSTNFTSTAYYTDKDVGYCDCIRFEVIKRNQEIFSFSVHCRTKRGSGTTWTLSMVDLIPTNTDDKSITGTILGGFKPGDPYNGKPFQMKYKPLDGSGYGMMRPTSSSTLSYYFFDNMGQVGLMYFGNNKEVFGYHTFSTTCVLRQDTSISCRIFEQDMDLGCIVLCDQVRIESFKVRIRVDELDTENNEALTGVKVIKEEGYKIPINHKVLHLQKGETFDFVVTETSDKNQSVLMYDTATGLILYRMNASEICPKENPGCKLDSLYIHQFGDNRILLLPEGGQLDNSMFIWQKPQLNFSRDQLRKSGSLKEFKLVINSVTTKETNKMISILDLFKPKQEDFFWVYLAFVIVLAIFLVLCFLLLLYMNWRAEERAQVRKEDKEREKNSGLDRVNRMSKQDYKEVPSEKENNRTSLLPQPSVAADTNRTSLYKKKTIKL